ncbi:hypothetical protein [Planomonospora venezuelensis]|uniref:Integral membrane protein n=1 Tax=Planomonospora venezuelensis TaxID=1999 RepID=A0A841DF03_PLAVE|nr:hypothetical protein [Planomonospora venezuelensis]MBB5966984.1 hypothetical protein [Planomonospora venezuelensis]GIN01547.1 hypothetical protein Pve01_32050 [Planomonospora venezuelensis]
MTGGHPHRETLARTARSTGTTGTAGSTRGTGATRGTGGPGSTEGAEGAGTAAAAAAKGRPFVAAALVSAACWFALGIESLVSPPPQSYRDALVQVPWVLFGAVLAGVQRAQSHRTGRFAAAALAVTLAGTAAATVGTVGVLLGHGAVAVVAFPVGPLLFSTGLVAFGVATARARVLPAWVGALIALSQFAVMALGLALSVWAPVSQTGSYTGGMWHGVTMLCVALALRGNAARR